MPCDMHDWYLERCHVALPPYSVILTKPWPRISQPRISRLMTTRSLTNLLIFGSLNPHCLAPTKVLQAWVLLRIVYMTLTTRTNTSKNNLSIQDSNLQAVSILLRESDCRLLLSARCWWNADFVPFYFFRSIDPSKYGVPDRPDSVVSASSNGVESAWRRRQTVKRGVTRKVKLVHGNFITEYPVPTPVFSAIEAKWSSTSTTEFS